MYMVIIIVIYVMLLYALLQVEVRLQKQEAIQWDSLQSTSAGNSHLVHKMALVEEASKLVLHLLPYM